MKQSDLIAIRDVVADDHAFIFSSWLQSAYYPHHQETTPKNAFMKSKHAEIEELLRTGRTLVATLKDDPDVIVGYLVFRANGDPVWGYVKKAWRNIGIYKRLLTLPKETL